MVAMGLGLSLGVGAQGAPSAREWLCSVESRR